MSVDDEPLAYPGAVDDVTEIDVAAPHQRAAQRIARPLDGLADGDRRDIGREETEEEGFRARRAAGGKRRERPPQNL